MFLFWKRKSMLHRKRLGSWDSIMCVTDSQSLMMPKQVGAVKPYGRIARLADANARWTAVVYEDTTSFPTSYQVRSRRRCSDTSRAHGPRRYSPGAPAHRNGLIRSRLTSALDMSD